MANRVIFDGGTSSARDPNAQTKLNVGTYNERLGLPTIKSKYDMEGATPPPWMYKGEDGQWYSEYDPSAPPKPGGGARWIDSNPYAVPMGDTHMNLTVLQETPDPVIPTAPMAPLGTIRRGPTMGAPREDNRTSKARFRTSTTSGLQLIGKGA